MAKEAETLHQEWPLAAVFSSSHVTDHVGRRPQAAGRLS